MTRILCLIVTLILLFSTVSARAQRSPDGYPGHLGCSLYASIPIGHVPPLRDDMPRLCREGYLFFDSLCRSDTDAVRLRDSLTKNVTTPASLARYSKYLYAMRDYDANLFDEYFYWGYADKPQFDFNLRWILNALWDRQDKILGRYNKLSFLVNSDVVLRVKIESVEGDVNNEGTFHRWQFFTARVLDTVKGIRLPTRVASQVEEGKDTFDFRATNLSSISFTISPEWSRHSRPFEFKGHHLTAPVSFGDSSIIVGSEYILCLDIHKEYYNGKFVFRDFWPITHYSPEAGIFRIDENKNVLIPSDYFGYGSVVPLRIFLSKIRQDIQSIVSP